MLSNFVLYRQLVDLLKAHKHFLLLGIITSLLAAAIDAGLAALLEPMINKGFSQERTVTTTWIGSAVITIMVVRAAMFFASDREIFSNAPVKTIFFPTTFPTNFVFSIC